MGGYFSSPTLMCDPVLLAKDLTGQVIIITGGNQGLGFTCAKQLASQGATVVIGARRPKAGHAAVHEIMESLPMGCKGRAEFIPLDLASLASVRAFVKEFSKRHQQLHTLLNNAGLMNTPDSRTEEGFEMQIGVNHLGHFLLTQLLLPVLRTTEGARVVVLSSCAHGTFNGVTGKIDLDDLNFETRPYQGWVAYGQSKLANLLFARELAERETASSGILTASVHPGFVDTNLISHTTGWFSPIVVWFARYFLQAGVLQPWEGAQTSLHCVLTDDLVSGAYYSQNQSPRGFVGAWPMQHLPTKEGRDEGGHVAKGLWKLSEQLVSGEPGAEPSSK